MLRPVSSPNLAQRLATAFNTPFGQWLINTPPLAWLVRQYARRAAARALNEAQARRAARALGGAAPLPTTLEAVARDVVEVLGYAGAMIAPYEPDGGLPVRALYVDPALASAEDIRAWERQVGAFSPPDHPVSITDPAIARVFVHQPEYQANLSVRAAQAGHPVTSDELFDLFTPIAPPAARPVVRGLQDALGIRQVIAVPFFIESARAEPAAREYVGNLFAATRAVSFGPAEIELLQAFGRQAAVGIRNARLYRQSENRRTAAQIFGKMAFSAAAAVHAFRNHIGIVRGYLQLVSATPDPARREQLLNASTPVMLERLDQITRLLETLHEPWQQTSDSWVDVNVSLRRAIGQTLAGREAWLALDFAEPLPKIHTSPEMLREAFKVVIKNAVEAVELKAAAANDQGAAAPANPAITITSRLLASGGVEVTVADTGTGVRPEHLGQFFEMRWTTKKEGLGFGLFWAKDYIDGLGGSLTVESAWQVGTTVRLTLPAAVPPSTGS